MLTAWNNVKIIDKTIGSVKLQSGITLVFKNDSTVEYRIDWIERGINVLL